MYKGYFEIWQPRYHDNKVLLATKKVLPEGINIVQFTETKMLFSLGLMFIAAFNAITEGQKRWCIVLYWSVVSLYWAIGVIS